MARGKPSSFECEDARMARTQGAKLAPASESTEDAASRCARSLPQMARAGIEPATPRFSGRRRLRLQRRGIPAREGRRATAAVAPIPLDIGGYRWVWA